MTKRSISSIYIRKASGEKELFNLNKLKQSLQNSGASEELTNEVSTDIIKWIYNGVTTQKIYSRAFSLLRKKQKYIASRYKLKKAIMELGPTGYPFEHFIGEILLLQGFSTEVGQVIDGYCVTHEVDVVATRGNRQFFVECKYGQSAGKTISVQVPLYIHSRVNDIIRKRQGITEYNGFNFYGWVVTNTRFSSDAISYGECSGLHLLSWDYPLGKGLKDIIDKERIYPITILDSLSKKQKQFLLDKGIVTCRQLTTGVNGISLLQLDKRQHTKVLRELEELV